MGLKKLVKKWINALIEEFDIWDIKVYTYEVKKSVAYIVLTYINN